jgi:DNA-binding MarR family transcriptional regulator
MPAKKPSPPTASLTSPVTADDHPWVDLGEDGAGLTVDNFITTLVVRTANALRRTVTLPYAESFDLTMAEWRMLSVLAEAGSLPFSEMVRLSATDKSLVSRTLRLLETRNLVALEAVNGSYRQGLECRMTEAGAALYRKAMPVAQKAQADMIRVLTNNERKVLYRTLQKLRHACGDDDLDHPEK